jgi:hypothetical protein
MDTGIGFFILAMGFLGGIPVGLILGVEIMKPRLKP